MLHTDKPIEGLVRSIAADAAGDENNALYDKTLSRSSGAGLLFNQTIRRMSARLSHAVMRGSSDAVISERGAATWVAAVQKRSKTKTRTCNRNTR